jgi:hypothetical protein
MKMINGIVGCTLVAGLMAFAPSQSQAANNGNVVGTDGQLYSPIKLKLVISKQNKNNKFGQQTVTSKTVLKELGYNSSVVLALGLNEDVVIINKKSGAIIANLTTNGTMTVSADQYLSSNKSNNGKSSYKSSGLLYVNFDSSGGLNNDSVVSEIAADSFTIQGVYSGSLSTSKPKNGLYNVNTNAKAKSLSGYGYFPDIYSYGDTVVTGSASVKGNGKIATPVL